MKNKKHKYKLGGMIYTSHKRWGIIIKCDWTINGKPCYEVRHTNGVDDWFTEDILSKKKKNWGLLTLQSMPPYDRAVSGWRLIN